MILIPDELRPRLLANGSDPGHDHVPLIKLFDPTGPDAWLISEIQPYDPDVVFGLSCCGGAVSVGPFNLAELHDLIRSYGFELRRDAQFAGRHPLSVYAEAARAQGAITEIPTLLDAAAVRLALRKNGGAL